MEDVTPSCSDCCKKNTLGYFFLAFGGEAFFDRGGGLGGGVEEFLELLGGEAGGFQCNLAHRVFFAVGFFGDGGCGVGDEAVVEDVLDFGAAGEVGLVVFAGADAFDEAGEVVGGGGKGEGFPGGGVDVAAKAKVDFVVGGVEVDAQGAGRAVDGEGEGVGMAGGPAGGLDLAKGAVVQFALDEGGVVGVEAVALMGFAFDFGEGFECAGQVFDSGANGVGGKVDDVDADVAQHALAAVCGGLAPQPGVGGAPVAPDFGGQPGLVVGGMEVDDAAEFAGGDEGAGLLQGGGGAVGELHHVDDVFAAGGVGHFFGVGVVGGEGFFAQDMFAGGDGVEGDGAVELVGGDDGDGVHRGLAEKFFVVGVCVGDAVFAGEFFDTGGVDVAGGGDGDAFDGGEFFGVLRGHAAGADDGDADHGGVFGAIFAVGQFFIQACTVPCDEIGP